MFKVTGNFDGLNKLNDKIKELKETSEVSFGVLFNESFISKHSKFSNLDELCRASGFKMETKEDFLAIPDEEWNKFISENTSFNNWEEMQKSAFTEFLKNKMKL